jgi:hypothetical protein
VSAFDEDAFDADPFEVGVTPSVIAGPYARMMAALLPPGKLWRLDAESILSKLFEACADELGRLDSRVGDLLNEADPSTADELLPEYERELELSGGAGISVAERQARVVARTIARQRFRPVDFQNALAPILGQLPGDVVVIERSHAFAASIGDDREIYRFFVYRDPGLLGDYFLESAQELVDKIKPTHTAGHVIESIDFLCDDPFSLCDRDILGA